MQASYSAIVLGWSGTFIVFVILALPKLLPLLELLKANMVELQQTSPAGMRQSRFLQSVVYSPEIFSLIPRFIAEYIQLLAVTMNPRHWIGIKITASALVLLAGILNPRHSARLWILLALAFLLACGPYAPLPIWRLLYLFPVFNTMYDFTKYWNVFALFTLCSLAAVGFDAITQLLRRVVTCRGNQMVRKITLGGIFAAATLHPFAHSFEMNWQLYQVPPREVTARQFYQVASVRWLGVTSTRNRGPDPGVDETVMYSNLKKNVGTITWYGAMAFPENSVPKFFITENGSIRENTAYRGEVYCATVQSSDCDIEHFIISYNRLTVSTGENFAEPSRIILNFNYDPRWSSKEAAVVNYNGLLAVALSDADSQNRRIVLNYTDRSFLVGLAFFLIGAVAWPTWYFRYYRVDPRARLL